MGKPNPEANPRHWARAYRETRDPRYVVLAYELSRQEEHEPPAWAVRAGKAWLDGLQPALLRSGGDYSVNPVTKVPILQSP